jgi:hypothetical protein
MVYGLTELCFADLIAGAIQTLGPDRPERVLLLVTGLGSRRPDGSELGAVFRHARLL